MHLFIDARFYGLEHTGLGRYTKNVVTYLPRHLKSRTGKVTLLVHERYKDLKVPRGWQVVTSAVRPYSLAEQFVIPRLVRLAKADLYLALHFNIPLLLHTPFVAVIHDLIKSHFSGKETTTHSPWLYQVKRWAYELTMRRTVRRAQALITPSNTVKNDILAHYPLEPSHIYVIPEAIDRLVLQKPPSPAPFTNYLLYVGNAYPHKNLQIVLAALGRLPYNLVLVSKRSVFLSSLLAKVPRNLLDRIFILEQVGDAELASLYQSAVAYLSPSLMEGYGLPGVEALALGVPLVASNIPVFREVFGHRATYFNPTSVKSLLEAISQAALQHPRPYIPKRTWDQVAGEIGKVIL